jgi:hypothetical protein
MRDPGAAHQLSLADIQSRDPFDDLLSLLILFQHHRLLAGRCEQQVVARKDRTQVKRNLIHVLEATLKRPMRDPQHPAETRPQTITVLRRQRATNPIFNAERAAR